MFNKFKLILLSAMLLSFGGCSSFLPYKMDIRQGNYVSAEMRSKIKIGMSRQQVASVLGSPLVSDVFHANRWDYIYRFSEKGKLVEQSRLTLFFDGEFLKRIDDSQMVSSAAVAPVTK
jgi:outer membrane protein assembly factor BamE